MKSNLKTLLAQIKAYNKFGNDLK